MIWLHGLGDTGLGWSDVGPQLQQLMPTVRFLFPTAQTQPVTVNGGMWCTSWFDINSLDPADFWQDPPGLAESAAYVKQLVQEQLDAGIKQERIVLAGFSQGGAVVLAASLGPNPSPVGGVFVLSSFLASPLLPVSTWTKGPPPIYFFHGEADRVVPYDWGARSSRKIQDAGFTTSWRGYRGMQHSACMEELQDIAGTLSALLTK